MRRGHTLVELCAALLILTIGTSFLAPAARRLRDRMAVVAAREALAGLVADARVQALARGEAVLDVRADSGSAAVAVNGHATRTVALRRDLGVEVVLPGGRTAAELRYDALGLGEVASESVSFRRGSAEAGVVISAYGRVRRR
jgi:Tfp pilus assembly protein FimT